MNNKNRDIEVLFFTGASGTGKTTFAKMYCEKSKQSYCITSSSNDLMQDYKGEDVLILNDLRDSEFSFTDLLKILDNHTASTIKSRYSNKLFIGSKIIITSYKPIDEWYKGVSDDLALTQLRRRVGSVYSFVDDYVDVKMYDEEKGKYVVVGRVDNVVQKLRKERRESNVLAVLEMMGLKVREVDAKNGEW